MVRFNSSSIEISGCGRVFLKQLRLFLKIPTYSIVTKDTRVSWNYLLTLYLSIERLLVHRSDIEKSQEFYHHWKVLHRKWFDDVGTAHGDAGKLHAGFRFQRHSGFGWVREIDKEGLETQQNCAEHHEEKEDGEYANFDL